MYLPGYDEAFYHYAVQKAARKGFSKRRDESYGLLYVESLGRRETGAGGNVSSAAEREKKDAPTVGRRVPSILEELDSLQAEHQHGTCLSFACLHGMVNRIPSKTVFP